MLTKERYTVDNAVGGEGRGGNLDFLVAFATCCKTT